MITPERNLKRNVIMTKTMTMMKWWQLLWKVKVGMHWEGLEGRIWPFIPIRSSYHMSGVICYIYILYLNVREPLEFVYVDNHDASMMHCLIMRYDINPLPISPGDQCVLFVKATSHYAEGQPVGPKHRCGINVEACLACSRVCLHCLV